MNILHALDYVKKAIEESLEDKTDIPIDDLEHTNIFITLSFTDERGMENAKVFENFKED